jgi:hypothetical protein
MHELFYCSYAKSGISNQDILDILEVSRKNNSEMDITGLLLYWEKTHQFLQVLEGDKISIFELYSKICDDPRHSSLKLIYDGEISERGFKGWSMAFKDLKEVDSLRISGFSDFAVSSFTNERTEAEASRAVNLIKSFRNLLPA